MRQICLAIGLTVLVMLGPLSFVDLAGAAGGESHGGRGSWGGGHSAYTHGAGYSHGGSYHGGYSHGGYSYRAGYYHGGYHRGSWGTRVYIGGGWWGWPYWGGPGWWDAPYYPYYGFYPPAAPAPAATEYIQQSPAPQYWYYCPNPQGYYPYVKECPAGWMQVVPQPAPPAPPAP